MRCAEESLHQPRSIFCRGCVRSSGFTLGGCLGEPVLCDCRGVMCAVTTAHVRLSFLLLLDCEVDGLSLACIGGNS